MSDMTIYFRDDSIIYVLKIPIVKDKDLTWYKLLPAPIKLNNQLTYVYIKPDVDYLVISINKEFFSVYNDHSLKSCKQALGFRLSKQRQISIIKNKLLNCGMALILKLNVLSPSCEIKYCKISNSIYHKLEFYNEWLFVVQNEDILLTCNQETISEMKELKGTELISIKENCKVYTTNELLLSERHVASKGQNHLDHVLNFKLMNYLDKNVNTYLVTSH
jgi:hypothetical protein